MVIFNNKKELKVYLNPCFKNNKTIGFVPTMGALHNGHLSLLEKSLEQNDIVVVSIFVNPTQFDNKEDLEKYPRTLENDIQKIETLNPNIIIYAPTINDIYGENIVPEKFDYDGLENQMEGKQRPGHFDGVGTIVKALFEIVKPTKAYFGEKDYQQVLIVNKMVEKHRLPVKIVVCPILREKNGLAMSSRNERLSEEERNKAGFIYQTLLKVKELFQTEDPKKIYGFVKKAFEVQELLQLEYFTIADSKTLLEITKKYKTKKYRAFIAVRVGNVRLIDTVSLN
ncbi:MAG: pantoate--beta-alanine ligase [Flavobacteriaceae bacterium]